MPAQSTASLALTSFATAAAAAAIEAAVRPKPTAAPTPARTAAAASLSGASALLAAAAALADSAVEHYRGAFHNKTNILPLVLAAQALGASLQGTAAARPSLIRHFGNMLSVVTGGRRHRVSFLQHHEATRRVELAQPVLRRADWRAGGAEPCRDARRPRRAAARQPSALRRVAGTRDRPPRVARPSRCVGRGGAHAFSRGLSEPGDGDPSHRSPRRGGAARRSDGLPAAGRAGRAGAQGADRRRAPSAPRFMPMASSAAWAAGATGRKTSSTARRCRRHRLLPRWRSPGSPR